MKPMKLAPISLPFDKPMKEGFTKVLIQEPWYCLHCGIILREPAFVREEKPTQLS
jgi:hypothetical protein